MCSKKILVIENDLVWQEILHETILEVGYQCNFASTYVEALNSMVDEQPVAITLDLELSTDDAHHTEWEGWDLAEKAQQYGIPLIIITGYDDVEMASKAFRKYEVLRFFFSKQTLHKQARLFQNMLVESIVGDASLKDKPQARGEPQVISRAKLRKLLETFFDSTGVQNTAFDLGVNYGALSGENMPDKIRSLISHMEQRGRYLELIAYCKEDRPDIDWS